MAALANTALSAEGLAFGYPGRTIGRDCSFGLESGRVTVLLGPNGSGKTTLFKTLLGLLPPHGGSLTLEGRPIQAYTTRERALRTGYVPQAFAGFFPFTVRETVLMGRTARLRWFETPGAADRAASQAALAQLGIGDLADASYLHISGGQRQLVLVARALAQQPALMILDEPTANLDYGNQVRVLECLRALARDGLAVLLSTHDPDHAFWVGDRVLLLNEGQLMASGAPESVITADMLSQIYKVQADVVTLPDGAGWRRVCVPKLPVR